MEYMPTGKPTDRALYKYRCTLFNVDQSMVVRQLHSATVSGDSLLGPGPKFWATYFRHAQTLVNVASARRAVIKLHNAQHFRRPATVSHTHRLRKTEFFESLMVADLASGLCFKNFNR